MHIKEKAVERTNSLAYFKEVDQADTFVLKLPYSWAMCFSYFLTGFTVGGFWGWRVGFVLGV